MKKINIIYSFFAFLLAFSACKEVGVDPLPMEPKGPEILSPTGSNTYTLVTENDNGAFETFIWEEAYFSDDAMVEYTVELDLATGDFSQPTILGKTEMHAYKTTVKEMNQICRDLGIIAGVPTGLQLRIKAQVNEEVKYSIPVSFLVDRYIYDDEVATWMVVGSGLENPVALMLDEESGLWKSEEPIQMIEGGFSFKNNNVYQDELGADSDITYAMEMSGSLIDSDGKEIPTKNWMYNITLDVTNKTFTSSEETYYTLTGSAVTDENAKFEMDGDTYSLKTDLVAGDFLVKLNATTPVNYGVTSASDNTLIVDGTPLTIASEATYEVMIDADMKLTIEEVLYSEQMYFVGTVNGWNPDAPYYVPVTNIDNGEYQGFANLDDGSMVKILSEVGSWDGYGAGSANGEIAPGGGDIAMKDQPNYDGPGQYFVKFSLSELTIELVKITHTAIVGDGANPGWPEEYQGVELTYDSDSKGYVADVTFNASGAWKFRFNNTWDYNLGGALTKLTFGGGDLSTPGAVENTVNLILEATDPYSATLSPVEVP